MSGYAAGTAAGGMGPGEGQTTKVGAKTEKLSPKDREVLCHTLCNCKQIGTYDAAGRVRRQRCVEMRLNAANAVSKAETGVPTEYRPEQAYDMTQAPPAPVMDDDAPLEPHSNVRQWIRDIWKDRTTSYRSGDVRRPDVVIVNDASQPPVQSNIKAVVEMKFPPDRLNRGQDKAYIEIAGSSSKFVTLGPADCGCGDEKGEKQTAPAKQAAPQSDVDELFGGSGSSSGSPSIAPLPLPPIPAFP